ncbi:MAG TPA: efflux RND transporter periplasmic adaptor subunit [Bradyrhizobium sp.]|nr:efflux RND transporter periplasmic adaptor subunit [Bradyrhizobium sp.]
MKRIALIIAAVVIVGGAGLFYWFTHRAGPASELVIYGNVDLRQIDLPFNNSERIATVLVQEGDHVRKGEVLARLDTSRLLAQVAQADAKAAAQKAVVERLHNGSRPEEIEQARANLASAKADALNAERQYERQQSLAKIAEGRGTTKQEVDNAQAAFETGRARVAAAQAALDLAIAGPRKEDIAQGEAQLQADLANLAFLREQLADATLIAPVDAVVRSRLMEPGEMASPQKPVFSLAVIDPKWIRAYISEVDLGKIHPGEAASISVDSFPDRRFEGWIGFISPIAEFTPKTVEMSELRTSLVYEVRVFVKDSGDLLRLGMPATVHLALAPARSDPPAVAREAPPAGGS